MFLWKWGEGTQCSLYQRPTEVRPSWFYCINAIQLIIDLITKYNQNLVVNICTLASFTFILGNTLYSDSFQDFIDRKKEIRETELLNKNNYTINIDNRIADIFIKNQMASGNNSLSSHY